MQIHRDFINVKVLDLKIYPRIVVYCFLSEQGKNSLNERYGNVDGRTVSADGIIFVFLTGSSIPTLVHELFHVVQYIMEGIGQKLDSENETWAYLLQYLTKEGIDFLAPK